MKELIQHYVDHLRNERNVSPHTLRNYLSDLVQFSQFLIARKLCLDGDGVVDARKVDIHVVRTYLAALTKDRKKSSMGRKLAALKGFFRYMVATHHLEKDPLRLIHSPKQEKPLPKFLSVDDVFQLLGAIEINNALDVRDRAILEVFYSTGVRASELVGLNFDRNIEGMSRNFIYLPERGRNIMVDVRAIREALDDVYDADRIVMEILTHRLFATEREADAFKRN